MLLYLLYSAIAAVTYGERSWRLTNIVEPNPQARGEPPRIYFLDTHNAVIDNQIRQYHVAVVARLGGP
jgi:hypothetical protein